MSNVRKSLALAGAVFMAATCVACRNRRVENASLGGSPMNNAGDRGGRPTIVAADEGEHRVRRIAGIGRFTIKVDPVTVHSADLVLMTEVIAPGDRIPPHIHPSEDEIIFVHAGRGAVELGDRRDTISTGATVYIPRSTRIAVRNSGNAPLEIVAIFSHPGFEQYLRDTSAPEGQTILPLTAAELASLRQKHAAHVVWERR